MAESAHATVLGVHRSIRGWLVLGSFGGLLLHGCYLRHADPRPRDGGRDAGTRDAGVPDTGVPDTGVPDTGVDDAGPFDDELSERYCRCMTTYCYAFPPGDRRVDACLSIADALPRAGREATEGDFIECRIHWCELHITSFDDTDCEYAAGFSGCR